MFRIIFRRRKVFHYNYIKSEQYLRMKYLFAWLLICFYILQHSTLLAKEKTETPDSNLNLFDTIRGKTMYKHRTNGSIWELDRGGYGAHGGRQWKVWNKLKDWENGVKPTSIFSNGTIRKKRDVP